MNRIDEKFSELARGGRKGMFPFLAAGQGGLDTTIDLILRFQQLGASGIELGFPFIDSIADGPVIRGGFGQALDTGVTTAKIFRALTDARDRITIPIVAMVSASIVYCIGAEKFLDSVRNAGIDAVLLPDLSLEEAGTIKEKAHARNLRFVMLVAPTSSIERQERIAQLATGFIYYMSVAGVTGERDVLPPELVENVRRLKELSGKPVLVGFGIKTAEQVRMVCSTADGAIVGSAFVRRIAESIKNNDDPSQLVRTVGDYLAELLSGLDQ